MHIDRRFRLPSYRALQEQRNAEAAQRAAIQNASDALHNLAVLAMTPLAEVAEFNGNVRPDITEADCRKKPTQAQQEEAKSPAGDGWIEHDTTKPCPVAEGTRVRVRLRTGQESEGRALRSIGMYERQWLDDGTPSDKFTVVAYRVISEPAAKQPQADADGWIKNTKTTPGCPPELVGKKLELRFARREVPEIWGGGVHCTAWDSSQKGQFALVITHYRVLG